MAEEVYIVIERHTDSSMWGLGTLCSYIILLACPYQILSCILNNQIIHFDKLYCGTDTHSVPLSLSFCTKEIFIHLQGIYTFNSLSPLLLTIPTLPIHSYTVHILVDTNTSNYIIILL